MHKITNKSRSVLSLAFCGRGLILQPKGKRGCSAPLLDHELDEPQVKNLLKAKRISLEPWKGDLETPQVDQAALDRVAKFKEAASRAKLRAKGKTPPPKAEPAPPAPPKGALDSKPKKKSTSKVEKSLPSFSKSSEKKED